ncbi:MAG: AAA family ATPase [Culicoidibacterales bacterium]
MKLSKVTVQNYRCFASQEVILDEKATVIIGINSAGKTTLLDAIAIALNNYLSQFPIKTSTLMKQTDVRKSFSENGSQINQETHFPLKIEALGTVFEHEVIWSSQLNGEKTRPTVKNLAELKKIITAKISNQTQAMPLVAYYGTGRLHLKTPTKKSMAVSGRFNYYTNALQSNIDMTYLNNWFEKLTYIQLQKGTAIPELQIVLRAVAQMYELSDSEIDTVTVYFDVKQSQLMIEIHRQGVIQQLPLTQMSDGVKTTLMMVADIAYRMASLNGFLLEHVLVQTPGVVIIDEVDLHLHPQWQKRILQDLQTIFPKIQWIVTTHAPSVLTNISTSQLRVLKDGVIQAIENQVYGKNIDEITRFVFGTDVRPPEVIEQFNTFEQALASQDFHQAKQCLKALERLVDSETRELVEARINYEFEAEFADAHN